MACDCGIRAATVTTAVNQEPPPCEIHKSTNISAQERQTRTVIGTADKKRTNFASCSGKRRRHNFRTAAIYPLLPGDSARRYRFTVNIARLSCEILNFIHTAANVGRPFNDASSPCPRTQAQKKRHRSAVYKPLSLWERGWGEGKLEAYLCRFCCCRRTVFHTYPPFTEKET